jgi:hypothetical protein
MLLTIAFVVLASLASAALQIWLYFWILRERETNVTRSMWRSRGGRQPATNAGRQRRAGRRHAGRRDPPPASRDWFAAGNR